MSYYDTHENIDKARCAIKDMKIVLPAGGMEVGTIVSVAGKVESCGKTESVELRNGGSSVKRVVKMRDEAPSGDVDSNVE